MLERHVAGAVAGMAVANGASLAAFVGAWRLMGPDSALETGTWRETDLFAGVVLALILLAGVAGGAVCVVVARRRWVATVTAAMLLAWWGAEACVRLGCDAPREPPPRAPAATMADGARAGLLREPSWSVLASPVVIGIGILTGSGVGSTPRLRKRRPMG